MRSRRLALVGAAAAACVVAAQGSAQPQTTTPTTVVNMKITMTDSVFRVSPNVVPRAALEAETDKLARRLADGPTHVYGNTKRLLYSSLENEFEAQLQLEAELFADCAARPDFREGVRAFVEKRKPRFSGQ